MLGIGYFLKTIKINSQQEKPICPNRKNKLPQKFRATWYLLRVKNNHRSKFSNLSNWKKEA